MMRPRITLLGLFVAATVALAAILGALLFAIVSDSRRLVLASAEQLREAAAVRAEGQLRREFATAGDAVADVERGVKLGAADPRDPAAIEAQLFQALARSPLLAEVTFTAAFREGFKKDGQPLLAKDGRWQVSVFRDGAALTTERIIPAAGGFITERRMRTAGSSLQAGSFVNAGQAVDPTDHPTFTTTASKRIGGAAIWTDLSYRQRDEALPPERRSVVLSVQKAVQDAQGRFAGVVRAGLLAEAIDRLTNLKVIEGDAQDPHRVFLSDERGRLISRLRPADRLQLDAASDSLRVTADDVPEPVRAALAHVGQASAMMEIDGQPWLTTFRHLANSQDWLIGIVVPEAAYTRELSRERARLLWVYAAVMAVVVAGGGLVLLALRRGLGSITLVASHMRTLDFAKADTSARFGDVQDVLEGLERAKTAMRALGKYVPIDLVRELYQANREPALGGELRELTILFTDLEGFTSLSEKLSPDALAERLGSYLAIMTAAIRSTNGTVDKFVGDAVMALWNAPTLREGHSLSACEAVLRCREATAKLYASPAWGDLPPLRTRAGLHRGRVMVGHFGAPDRLSYTAIGDGVNLAARLESLCKQYGIEVLASSAVVEAARSSYLFRLIDKVAVKGKTQAVEVYELLGRVGEPIPKEEINKRYEAAFEAYQRRDFNGALALANQQLTDGPSRTLAERCKLLVAEAPGDDWDGVYRARSK